MEEGRSATHVGPEQWRLPEGLKPSRRTAVYEATTIPAGMLAMHHTCGRLWAEVVVLQGRLQYVVYDAPRLGIFGDRTFEVSSERPALLYPQAYHHVKPLTDDVRFYVQFFAQAT